MTPTSNRILLWGTGPLLWMREVLTPLGRQWETGQTVEGLGVGETLRFGIETARPSEAILSLATAIDRELLSQQPSGSEPSVRVERVVSTQAKAPRLKEFSRISAGWADWVTRSLGGPGVLILPDAWRRSPMAARLVASWCALGWRLCGLRRAFGTDLPPKARIVTGDGPYLRVSDSTFDSVIPNGPEAAAAFAIAKQVLDQIVDGPFDRSDAEGWFCETALTMALFNTLCRGGNRVVLGGVDPMFGRRVDGIDRMGDLSAYQFRVEWDSTAATGGDQWWSDLEKPGALVAAGRPFPGIEWRKKKNVLVDGPGVNRFKFFMMFNGLSHRTASINALRHSLQHSVDGPSFFVLDATIPPRSPIPEFATRPDPAAPGPASLGPRIAPALARRSDRPRPTPETMAASLLNTQPTPAWEQPNPGKSILPRRPRRGRKRGRAKAPDPPPTPEASDSAPPPRGQEIRARFNPLATVEPPAGPPPPKTPERAPAKPAKPAPTPVPEAIPISPPPAFAAVTDDDELDDDSSHGTLPEYILDAADLPQSGGALAEHDPEQFELRLPHRHGSLRVRVDGVAPDGAGLHPEAQPGAIHQSSYRLELRPRYGAIVRVDYDPEVAE